MCIGARHIRTQQYLNYYLNHINLNENGLRAYYYNNPEWKGKPVLSRVEKGIYLKLNSTRNKGPEGVNIGKDSFSIKWHGLLTMPLFGKHKFRLVSDDGSRLFLNGVPIVKNDGIHPARKVSARKYIRKGTYPVEIRYFQMHGEAIIYLYWRPPHPLKDSQHQIPLSFLHPVNSEFNQSVAYKLNGYVKKWTLLVKLSIFIFILGIVNLWAGFFEKIYFFVTSSIKENFIASIVLLLGIIFRSLFLGSIPGIHGDETWSTLRALSFLEGREISILRGMTSYSGPFFLLQAPVYTLLGYNPIALRVFPVFFNTLALLFCYMLVKRIYDARTGLFSIIILSFLPITFMYSRISWEITTFSLFFLFLALYLIYSQRPGRLILAGFVLGAGVYNHLLFICVPVSLFLVGILETKGKLVFYKRFYLVLIPILLLCSIRILDIKYFGTGHIVEPSGFSENIYRLKLSITAVLPQVLDGTLLYKLFTGRALVKVFPVNLILIGICILSLFIKRTLIDKNLLRLIFIGTACYLMIFYHTSGPSPRYFLIPVTLLGLIPSVCLGKIAKERKRILKFLAIGTVFILSAVNIFYICINYFYSYRKTNGGCFHEHLEGLRFPTFVTSHHYVDTRELYEFLTKTGFNRVASYSFVTNNLLFWDIGNHLLQCYGRRAFREMPNECVIFYDLDIAAQLSSAHIDRRELMETGDVKNFRIYRKNFN